MPKVMVTRPGAILIADGEINYVTCLRGSVEYMDRKLATAKGSRRIASKYLEKKIEIFKRRGVANLTDGGQIRFAVSMGLVVISNGIAQITLGTYDEQHPTMPLHASVCAGHLGDNGLKKPRSAAFREVCEEFILTNGKEVGFWSMDGEISYRKTAKEYARWKGLDIGERIFKIHPTTSDIHGGLRLDGVEERQPVIHSFEAETSNYLIGYTGEVCLENDWYIVDGEKLPGGKWRDTPVVSGNNIYDYSLTSSAENFVDAFNHNLRPWPTPIFLPN